MNDDLTIMQDEVTGIPTGGLRAFMAENALHQEHTKIVVSKRFQEDGRPVAWEARPITGEQDEILRKKYTRTVQVTGKPGQYRQDFDSNAYLAALAVACTVYPDLNNVELQNSYSVMGGEALLKRMLLPGEYSKYLEELQALNGFTSFAEDVDHAKN